MYRIGLTRKLHFFATNKPTYLWLLVAPLLAAVLYWHWRPLASPIVTGELVVLTRISPTTFYIDNEGNPAGFEYDLVNEFAREHDWKLKIEVADNLDNLITETAEGRVNIAAAGLSVTSARAGQVLFGPSYATEKELVICGTGVAKPRSFADLAGLRLEVIQGSSHAERLVELRQAYPDLHWVEVSGHSTEELLERVSTGLSDCTVADSSTFAAVSTYTPGLVDALTLTDKRDIAWAMPLNADMGLRQAVSDFFRKIRANGRLEQLRKRYFSLGRHLGDADIQGILSRRLTLLPKYRDDFIKAQAATGLDWRLLAALAYQESQWNPLATSATGVRGIMMLTTDTADRMHVPDRLDAASSILGGAKYLNMLKDQLSDRIKEPDRTWFALAAYNVGIGHLEDARRLAQRLGKNPDSWHDVREVLPLLSNPNYADKLRYGYARGGEGKVLAENVRLYYQILKRLEPSQFNVAFQN